MTEVTTIIFLVAFTDFLPFISKHGIDLTDMHRGDAYLSAWKIGWQISLSGSVSASLYCTYSVQVTAILGDMGDFFANFIC